MALNYGQITSNDTSWHRILWSFDGTQSTNAAKLIIYLDGAPKTITFTGAIPTAIPANAQAFTIGRDSANSRWSNGLQDDITIWNRPLTPAEVWSDYELSLQGYPGVLNRLRPTPTLFISSGITGTGAITLGALTVSGVGSFADTATGAITLAPLSVAATGTLGTTGSGAITLGALTPSGAGTFKTTASGSIALAALSVSGTGTLAGVGTGAITLGALGVSGAGTAAILGSGAITLGSVIVVGAGTASGGTTNYDLVTAIQQWFLGQPSLQALFSDGQAHHLSAAEETLLPYLTYFKVSDTVDIYTTAGTVHAASVQFNVHAATDAQAQSIADQLADALNTVKQHADLPIVVYGQNAVHSLPKDFGVQFGEGLAPHGQDCWIVHFSIDVPYVK